MSYGQSEVTDNVFVRGVLWDILPETRDIMQELEREEYECFGGEFDGFEIGMYTLVSEVFIEGALRSFLEAPRMDENAAYRCAEVIEQLLGSGRASVLEMVSIRITDYLLGYIEPWLRFKRFAGPLLHREVDERKQYYTGPF